MEGKNRFGEGDRDQSYNNLSKDRKKVEASGDSGKEKEGVGETATRSIKEESAGEKRS